MQKFGGSSLSSTRQISLLARRLVRDQISGDRLVVVVSAMGRTTEDLLAQAQSLSRRPDPRELDMLLTAGERITMALLALAIIDCGGRAISLTGSQSGIITDESHAAAKILEVRPERIVRALHEEKIVIVAGFQGMSRSREVTTLGRGGSDTTAVSLAAALNAEVCEIYSDVAGVFAADPHLLPDAPHLPTLDYETMAGLSLMGARVLAPDAVAMAARLGVHLHLGHRDGSGAVTRLSTPSAPPSARVLLTLLPEAYAFEFPVTGSIGQALAWVVEQRGEVLGLAGRSIYVRFYDAHRDRDHFIAVQAKRFGAECVEVSVVTVLCSALMTHIAAQVYACSEEAGLRPLRMLAVADRLSLVVPRHEGPKFLACLGPLAQEGGGLKKA